MEQGQRKSGLRVAVIGAGIVGASITYHLARRGVSVTVIEKRQPGSGASSHSFAWINATAKTPASYHDFNRRSLEKWDRFAHQLQGDIGLRWGGELRWASTPEGAEEMQKLVRQLQGWGYPSRTIDESELRELEPGISPGTVAAAALHELDGRVNPQSVVDACLKWAAHWNTTVRRDTAVTGLALERKGDGTPRVEAVHTTGGDIGCDAVVLAAGVDTTRLAAMAGIRVPQEESPGVVVRTTPLPPVLHKVSVLNTPALDVERAEIHLRQNDDGTVMIGEGTQESLRRDDSQQHADDLLSRARSYLPALAGARSIPVPVGYRPMPLDGYPILGFSEKVPNIYIALTHSGVTLAPLIGELATLEIVDGARVEALKEYRPGRFP